LIQSFIAIGAIGIFEVGFIAVISLCALKSPALRRGLIDGGADRR
jgi:hypothetical protein